jgi:hypothetical protein
LNVDFDPVELLTRLATALCDDEDKTSVISFHDDLPNDDPSAQLETGIDSNIRRSNRSITALLTMDESKKIEVNRQSLHEQMNRRSLRNSRRVRRVSETIDKQPLAWSLSDSRSPPGQRRITLEEGPGRRLPVYQRSFSENQPTAFSRFDPLQHKPESAITSRDCEPAPVVQAPLSVVEFCDLLDRVQISRQNSTAPTQ